MNLNTVQDRTVDRMELPHPEVRTFLYREARLLDTRQWDAWNALFDECGHYWVPLSPDQPDPINHVSLFYENSMMRDVRVRRLRQKEAWSQHPPGRTARIIGNIMVDTGGGLDEVIVHSTFQLFEMRQQTQRALAGFNTHHLIRVGETLKIRLKRVDLINSQDPFDPLELFI